MLHRTESLVFRRPGSAPAVAVSGRRTMGRWTQS